MFARFVYNVISYREVVRVDFHKKNVVAAEYLSFAFTYTPKSKIRGFSHYPISDNRKVRSAKFVPNNPKVG